MTLTSSALPVRAMKSPGRALVRAHQTPVFRLAYLLLGSADEAEDVTQETFIRAYRSLGRFDTSRPLRPWLFKIAANLAHNQRRSMGRYLAALGRLFQVERWIHWVPRRGPGRPASGSRGALAGCASAGAG